MESISEEADFRHTKTFVPGELSGSLGLGPLETQYEELFAEALADGVITEEERMRLAKAAENLGLDRARLLRLEQAMVAAYQAHHHVRVVEQHDSGAESVPNPSESSAVPARALLMQRIEELEVRVRELEADLARAKAAVNLEVNLSDLESAADQASEDPEALWRRVRRNPANAETLQHLYRVYEARGNDDASFCVAQALIVLDAATPEQRARYEQHRQQGLIAPRAGVSPAAWYDLLFHPEQELLTGQIFSVIAPAALVGRVTALRRDGKLHLPPPSARHDPASSTITAVRAVGWAAAILGVAAPRVFVERDRDVGYEHLAGVPPATIVGRRALSGMNQLEHAFLVGRHLTLYRAEHFIKTLFPTIPQLEDLFLAALTIGNPGLPVADAVRQRITPIVQAVQPLLEPAQLDALRGCFLRFAEEGGRTNLLRFSEAVDKTSCRAGLLLAGDLPTAARLLEAEEGRLGEQTRDLVAFVTSERYLKLRRQLGITVDGP